MTKAIVTLVIVLALSLGAVMAVMADKPEENTNGKPEKDSKGNGIDLTGAHYNLNIIGKKSDWSGGGSYNNPDRHTMFVPENTSTFSYTTPDNVTHNGSVGIEFRRGNDFAVLDGTAYDDGWCQFQVARGTYRVYITCKAKPGYTSDIGAWVYAENTTGSWFHMDVGQIEVKGRKFVECTDLFYVTPTEDVFGILNGPMWVFDYLEYVSEYDFSLDPNYDDIVDAMYFWDLQNNGNKLIKLRFYEV
jgi:hypothetical protein